MGKALIIRGADFSNNAVAQITVISDEVRALFNGHNVGEKGMFAFLNFINNIGGLNGILWSKMGRMYVPMLFESDSVAKETMFDVKNNNVLIEINPSYATYSFYNNHLTITTTTERTTELPISIASETSLASVFGIVDTLFVGVGGTIALHHGYNTKWNRGSNNVWTYTSGWGMNDETKLLRIAAFSDAENNSDISHAFIKSDSTPGYETSGLTGTLSSTRSVYLKINPSGADISIMVVGYFIDSLTETELKTVTSALYQMFLDING